MQFFKATLYGPELPLIGITVDAGFNGHDLLVNEQHIHVDTDKLTVSVGSFEHNELYLIWQDNSAARWAIKPLSGDDIALAIASAPPELQPQLAIWGQRRHHIQWVWGSIATLASVCFISAILLWWQYDHAVAWVADHVSIANEERLGNSLLTQIKSEGNTVEKGLAVTTVQDIGNRLTQGSRYHYRWLVKKDKTVNAFALPGGIVIVHTALLAKTDNANELAAVLAHEIQHVEQRHSLKNMIHSLGWAALLMVALGDVNTATAVIIHQIGTMYFSRDIEDEADRLGYQALVRAKITPDGMVTFFQKMEKQSGAELPAWVSSHPATDERVKTIQKLLQEQPCADCQPLQLDWKKLRADKLLQQAKS